MNYISPRAEPLFRLQLQEFETLVSYMARLVRTLGYRSIDAFLDRVFPWPVTLAEIERGQKKEEIARFLGLPADFFDAHTPVRQKRDGAWRIGSEELSRDNGFGPVRRLCPACLDEDASALDRGCGSAAPYLRVLWTHQLVTACPVHFCAMVEAAEPIEFLVGWNGADWRFAQYRKPRPLPPIGERVLSCFIAGRLGYGERLPEPAELRAHPLDTALNFIRRAGSLLLAAETRAAAGLPNDPLISGMERIVGARRSLAEILSDLAARPLDQQLKPDLKEIGSLLRPAVRPPGDQDSTRARQLALGL